MQNVFLIPARDAQGKALRVVDPTTGDPLPAEGAFKERSQYWLRRIQQQDVSEGKPPSPAGFTETVPAPLLPPPARPPRGKPPAKAAASSADD